MLAYKLAKVSQGYAQHKTCRFNALKVKLLSFLTFLSRSNLCYNLRESVWNHGIFNLHLGKNKDKCISKQIDNYISVIIYCLMTNGKQYSNSSTPNKPEHQAC